MEHKCPKSFHHFQSINNRFISHCAHIYLTISVTHNHAGSTVIGAPYLCFEFGPVLVWYWLLNIFMWSWYQIFFPWYWVFFKDFNTSLVLVLGPRLIFGWYEADIYIYIPTIETSLKLIQGWYYLKSLPARYHVSFAIIQIHQHSHSKQLQELWQSSFLP